MTRAEGLCLKFFCDLHKMPLVATFSIAFLCVVAFVSFVPSVLEQNYDFSRQYKYHSPWISLSFHHRHIGSCRQLHHIDQTEKLRSEGKFCDVSAGELDVLSPQFCFPWCPVLRRISTQLVFSHHKQFYLGHEDWLAMLPSTCSILLTEVH